MSIIISNNQTSRKLVVSVNQSFEKIYSSLEKLSSGFRINSASDGPATLIISEQLRTRIASLSQEIENTSLLIGKYDTASSTISSLRSSLNDLRSLAVAAANEGGNSESAQQAYDTTAGYLTSYHNDVLANAEYNGMQLLDGSENALASISQLVGIDMSSSQAAEAAIETIDEAITELDSAQSEIGAAQKNDLQSSLTTLETTRQNLIAAESNLRDTDFALEFSNFLSEALKSNVGLSLMSHLALSSKSVIKLLNSH